MSKNVVKVLLPLFFVLVFPLSQAFTGMGTNPHMRGPFKKRGCGVCHVGHGAPRTPMLPEPEEKACYRCHGEEWSKTKEILNIELPEDEEPVNVERSFEKPYRHPVELKKGKNERGAECTDCHNPHEMRSMRKKRAPGTRKENPYNGQGYEYELCFKCHADVADLPPTEKDKKMEFEGMRSSHPVVYAKRSGPVPSLKPALWEGAFINCTDCHGSDDLADRGVHGSIYPHILRYNYQEEDGTAESEYTYALCYSCHDRMSILRDESFRYHSLHVSENQISCHSCHDPHGSNNPYLIRFSSEGLTEVEPSSSGKLEYESYGPRSGACFVSCHGKDHDPARY